MNTATMILSIAMGFCIGYLACMRLEGVGGMPLIGRESYDDLQLKLEIAEGVITDQPIDVQKDYTESLATWQLFSQEAYQSVKVSEDAAEIFDAGKYKKMA